MSGDPFRCICDPDNLFEPPRPTPVAVVGCPAHRFRRAAQQLALGADAEEVAAERPRCQEPTCPDYGDPDFGEATCPAEHAEPRAERTAAEETPR